MAKSKPFVMPVILTQREREALGRAARAAQDFPFLPTPGAEATPHVPEEPGDNLTPGQRLAVAALVGGQTFAAAARAANVSVRTLYSWRKEPAFARAVERTSRESLATVVVRVRNLMLRATRVLSDAMDEGRESSPVHAFRVINSARLWTEAASDAATYVEDDPAPAAEQVDGQAASTSA